MKRRAFLLAAAASASPVAAREVAATLTIHPDRRSPRIPVRYTGLSYEASQLAEPEFFSPRNRDLAALFRRLSARGVLRVGGNSSEFTWWKASPEAVAPPLKRPSGPADANWMPHELAAITPQAIDNLAAFLDDAGWKLIYGLNLGTGTPERAAEEAAYVAKAMGARLEYFQIGNEPDLYPRANNGLRPPSWTFDKYLAEWMKFASAIFAFPSPAWPGPGWRIARSWNGWCFPIAVRNFCIAPVTRHSWRSTSIPPTAMATANWAAPRCFWVSSTIASSSLRRPNASLRTTRISLPTMPIP